MDASIVVVGSLVVDLTIWLPRQPAAGETVLANRAAMFVGGKGANQAVQVRRLGDSPLLIGKIGRDPLGSFIQDGLQKEGILLDGIDKSLTAPTSYAVPVITPNSQYILHVPGANRDFDAVDLHPFRETLERSRWLLVQGEIPAEVSLQAMRWTHQGSGLVLCDPAPVDGMTELVLDEADVLTPNQVEMAQLLGQHNPSEWRMWAPKAQSLFQKYPRLRLILVTLGQDGALMIPRDQPRVHFNAPQVQAVDPTGAGDAFNGAWVWAVSQGWTWHKATQFAVAVGSQAAAKPGAMASLPTMKEMRKNFPEVF
ncbi:MAG: ribokinase [Sulfobacillus benefaciens]|uniref:Ribokinase n=1 Tax=Sulfobacillus benefaciens TaxID=453960 RepID=A0A2T2X7N3_9FIRM|nr:MAG: ribokinase [Sulfobacillus benefaciens]